MAEQLREVTERENVVPLPGDRSVIDPPPPPSPPGRLHGLAIAGMGISAIVGVAAMLAFITVTWPDNLSRVVIAICLLSGLVFLACASTAVLSAARDTYRNDAERRDAA